MSDKKILIVDDDLDYISVTSELLKSSGYQVISAYEGIRAVEIAHREKPDLIMLDWKMPAGEGGKVLDFLIAKEDTKNIPVIIVSGVDIDQIDKETKKQNVKAVVKKPFNSQSLLQTIRETLAWSKMKK